MTVDIEHIAKLAHLEFNESEMQKIQRDMEDIVEMVSSLSDDKNCPKIVNSVQLRADEQEKEAFDREEILLNAPQVYNGFIAVPKTVG